MEATPKASNRLSPEKTRAFQLLLKSGNALLRENKDVLYASMIKDTMKRKQPSFAESAAGYSSFSELLEDAAEYGLIGLRRDERSGTYVMTIPRKDKRRRT